MPSLYKKIDGWMDYENLYNKIATEFLKKGSTFVEVGSWKGKSICYMAELAKENDLDIKLFCVDIFANILNDGLNTYKVEKGNDKSLYFEFLTNLYQNDVLDKVTPLALFSEDAAKLFKDESIECIFIDADHNEKNIINDLDSWIPKLKKSGIICGHDYAANYGVQPYVDKYFKNNYKDKVIHYPKQCFIWQKK
jgi:predicted O-methyltransferase YrrM